MKKDNHNVWTDSHCHLDFPDFQERGVDDLLEQMRLNNVKQCLTISTHTERLSNIISLVERYDNVYGSVGVHPHNVDEPVERDITEQRLIELASKHEKIIAIGESGLDHHYDNAPRKIQERLFREHIRASIVTGLPLVIHARDADKEVIRIMEEERTRAGNRADRLKGVFHCFSSGRGLAEYGLSIGFYISFSGIVTFKSAADLRQICTDIPIDRILVETDAPFLAPKPYRGKTNEPAFVPHTGRVVAECHEIDEAEMAKITTDNFEQLFLK